MFGQHQSHQLILLGLTSLLVGIRGTAHLGKKYIVYIPNEPDLSRLKGIQVTVSVVGLAKGDTGVKVVSWTSLTTKDSKSVSVPCGLVKVAFLQDSKAGVKSYPVELQATKDVLVIVDVKETTAHGAVLTYSFFAYPEASTEKRYEVLTYGNSMAVSMAMNSKTAVSIKVGKKSTTTFNKEVASRPPHELSIGGVSIKSNAGKKIPTGGGSQPTQWVTGYSYVLSGDMTGFFIDCSDKCFVFSSITGSRGGSVIDTKDTFQQVSKRNKGKSFYVFGNCSTSAVNRIFFRMTCSQQTSVEIKGTDASGAMVTLSTETCKPPGLTVDKENHQGIALEAANSIQVVAGHLWGDTNWLTFMPLIDKQFVSKKCIWARGTRDDIRLANLFIVQTDAGASFFSGVQLNGSAMGLTDSANDAPGSVREFLYRKSMFVIDHSSKRPVLVYVVMVNLTDQRVISSSMAPGVDPKLPSCKIPKEDPLESDDSCPEECGGGGCKWDSPTSASAVCKNVTCTDGFYYVNTTGCTPCAPSFHGSSCLSECDSDCPLEYCDHVTGECEKPWEIPLWLWWVGIVVAVLLILLGLYIFVMLLQRICSGCGSEEEENADAENPENKSQTPSQLEKKEEEGSGSGGSKHDSQGSDKSHDSQDSHGSQGSQGSSVKFPEDQDSLESLKSQKSQQSQKSQKSQKQDDENKPSKSPTKGRDREGSSTDPPDDDDGKSRKGKRPFFYA